MKWEKVTSTIGQSAYTLWNNGRKLVTLVFNPNANAARVETDEERRVFLIRKEGFLRNRTVLRNEYGVRVGCAGTENNRPFIELDNQRFFYDVESSSATSPSLSIYSDVQTDKPLAVCELDAREKSLLQELQPNKALSTQAHYSLLMAVCWYLLPLMKDEHVALNLV